MWELLVRVLGFVSSLLFSFTFRIVYKDFMRHFVLNLKSQEGNSLTRPKLQPSRMPVSSLLCVEENSQIKKIVTKKAKPH